MSGTPIVGNEMLSAEGAIAQLERLLSFLREPTYGVDTSATSPYDEMERRNGSRWKAQIAKPMARLEEEGAARLSSLLQPLMVRHTKADLRLPEPIWLPTYDASLAKVDGESERAFTSRVSRHAAQHILDTMHAARAEWRAQEPQHQLLLSPRARAAARRAPPPKAVVFSEFENDLEQVNHWMTQLAGEEAVAYHFGEFRSTELARFRNGRTSYRRCPRCSFHNDAQVNADTCDRRLLDVMLESHDAEHVSLHAELTAAQVGRCWPVERERVFVRAHGAAANAAAATGQAAWRPWEPDDGLLNRNVWLDPTPHLVQGSSLPAPEWPAGGGAAPQAHGVWGAVDGHDLAHHLGGPGNRCFPARLRGFSRCGAYRGPRRSKNGVTQYHGCPPCWEARGVFYDEGAEPILRRVPWSQKAQDTYALLLCEDGSHGLDLSFVTHLFLVNAIDDPAKRQQVVSRAHRMGATVSVRVETMHMWND
mmetsp:Transcript_7966/g.20897  ORF Transcript_7966/g.20897 Transcript_7966/m.20897 type:complete len:478 (+) Transcript_7966:269-1702(+)